MFYLKKIIYINAKYKCVVYLIKCLYDVPRNVPRKLAHGIVRSIIKRLKNTA